MGPEEAVSIGQMERWNLTLNASVPISWICTYGGGALGLDHGKPQKDPLSSTFS